MSLVHYSSAVGSLMYAMVCTRPNIAHALDMISCVLSNLGKENWETVKLILRYLKGTSKICLCHGKADPIVESYVDLDMAEDLDNRKYTS